MLLGPVQVVGWQHTVCAEDVPAVTTALDRLRSGGQEPRGVDRAGLPGGRFVGREFVAYPGGGSGARTANFPARG